MGVCCTGAQNGQQALEMFAVAAPGTYAMIFMDVRMPVMNGYEATKAIRKLERPDARQIPIVAMTADAFSSGCWCLVVYFNKNLAKSVGWAAILLMPAAASSPGAL